MTKFLFKIVLNHWINRVSKLYAVKHGNKFGELFTTKEFKIYIEYKLGCILSDETIESILLSNTKLWPSVSSTGRWFKFAFQSRNEALELEENN